MSLFAHPLDAIAVLAVAALFGGMLLFVLVVTPTVFRSLGGAPAQSFLRALFPIYYVYLAVTALVGCVATITPNPRLGMLLAAIAVSAAGLRQFVMPRVNAARDAEQAGDAGAAAQFRSLHRLSFAVNLAQLLVAGVVVVRLLR